MVKGKMVVLRGSRFSRRYSRKGVVQLCRRLDWVQAVQLVQNRTQGCVELGVFISERPGSPCR